jgi:hypothetical protein
MLSYDDCELIRELYPASDFWIDELVWSYAGTTSVKKRLARELVITNYRPPFVDGWRRGHTDDTGRKRI